MSSLISAAVETLSDKIGSFSQGVAKFVMPGEGAIMMDPAGVRAADEAADVTLTATPEVFEAILAGTMNPMSAFMTGKLSVDGDMGLAMKLGSVLS